jgi:hypothetical protein
MTDGNAWITTLDFTQRNRADASAFTDQLLGKLAAFACQLDVFPQCAEDFLLVGKEDGATPFSLLIHNVTIMTLLHDNA